MEKEKSKYKTGARDILKICLLVDLSSSPLSPQQSRFLQLWADSQRFPPDPSDGTIIASGTRLTTEAEASLPKEAPGRFEMKGWDQVPLDQ